MLQALSTWGLVHLQYVVDRLETILWVRSCCAVLNAQVLCQYLMTLPCRGVMCFTCATLSIIPSHYCAACSAKWFLQAAARCCGELEGGDWTQTSSNCTLPGFTKKQHSHLQGSH